MAMPLIKHIDEITERFAYSPRVLVGLDYDGTLTPIVEDPRLAQLSDETRGLLAQLMARRHVSVAVISGRSLDDLQNHVALSGITLAGNHGMEISGPEVRFTESNAAGHRSALAELAEQLQQQLRPISGAAVEDKGLSLSVHFRQVASRDEDAVRRVVEAAISNWEHAIRLTLGHKVFECRPRVDWHKGKAVTLIRDHLGGRNSLVFYVGDDETDEDAFHALSGAITVKVGDATDTSAGYYVDSPDNVRELLAKLVETRRPEDKP